MCGLLICRRCWRKRYPEGRSRATGDATDERRCGPGGKDGDSIRAVHERGRLAFYASGRMMMFSIAHW